MKTFVLNQTWQSEYSDAPAKVEVTLTSGEMNTILKHVEYLRGLGKCDLTRIEMTCYVVIPIDSDYRIGYAVMSIDQHDICVKIENKWSSEDRAEYEGIDFSDLTSQIKEREEA